MRATLRDRDHGDARAPLARIDTVVVAARHLVLIPSYNSGAKLQETVAAALQHWQPVWVVIDGSSDGSGEALAQRYRGDCRVRVLQCPTNRGKGAAVLEGLQAAKAKGLTHVLVLDADGQHPADSIPKFMELSASRPDAMVLGVPMFDRTAPRIRIIGRRISNALARLETLGAIDDSLFGFRVYPLAPLCEIMEATRFMRRFDFDAEAAVRLSWSGLPVMNVPARVRYFGVAEGGVSHFRYGRDNVLLALMHARLLTGFCLRLPHLLACRLRSCPR